MSDRFFTLDTGREVELPEFLPIESCRRAAAEGRLYSTTVTLRDREGRHRTFSYEVIAGSEEQAQRIADLRGIGEEIDGCVEFQAERGE